MPQNNAIDPKTMLRVIREQADKQVSPWVPARTIKLIAGQKHNALQRSADYLYASGKIERRWIVSQWWYRLT